jgi:diguanylate cyclase (GGDEF)-like protein
MRELAAPIPRERVAHSRIRLSVLGAAALACPVLLITESVLGERIQASPIALGSIAAFVLVLFRLADVMHHQQAAEAQVRHQAFHDALTGLANRSLFYDRLEHAIDLSRRELRGLAVLLIDLDRFKPINDSLGHAAGDELLVAVAHRIRGCLRANDTAARLGGDEFVVLAEGVATADGAGEVAERVMGALAEPFVLAGAKVPVGASIGVAFAPVGAGSADELLNNADAAMYSAKRAAAGTYRVFELSMLASMNSVDHIGGDAEILQAVP